jgi:hypothetical protein
MIACVFLLSILFTHVNGKDKALLDIVMHKSDRNGEYTTEVEKLLGHFTTAGSMVSAEGQVFQVRQGAMLWQCFQRCTLLLKRADLLYPLKTNTRTVYFQ